jgi:hypothetical protein
MTQALIRGGVNSAQIVCPSPSVDFCKEIWNLILPYKGDPL